MFFHNPRSGTANALRSVEARLVHHPRARDRGAIALPCLLSWLGQALSAGLDRAPILPKTSAASARLRSAPPLSNERIDELLAIARLRYLAANPSPTFAWGEFDRRVRLRLARYVHPSRHRASTDLDEGAAPFPSSDGDLETM